MSDSLRDKQDNNFFLPGLNCGSCGFKSCEQFREFLLENPGEIKRCFYLGAEKAKSAEKPLAEENRQCWKDTLDREFDFILDPLEMDEGPRETIHPYNVQVITDLNLKEGDIIIGRPIAAGCPVTHCGRIMDIDKKSGLIDWCVIGPLLARNKPLSDIGGYAPTAFTGLVKEMRKELELKVGERYYWMPRRCMLQWRHSGLISSLMKTKDGYHQVRIEGVFLG